MDDITWIIKSLENSGLLINGAPGTVSHEIKKKEGRVLPALMAPMAALLITPTVSSLIQLATSSLVKGMFGKGIIERQVLNKSKNKSITHYIFRTQSDNAIMCGVNCITIIDHMIAAKTFINYTILSSPHDYKKEWQDNIKTKKYFKSMGISTLKINMAKENVSLTLD